MSLLLSSANQPRRRCVVLGLDGLPLDLALKLGKTLPNIGRLAEHATTVTAEIPELSPVNWTSFYTGKGPEEHGIFGFSTIDENTSELHVANASQVSCPTIFDLLGEANLVSRVINLPNTYPASPMRGMLIAGFVAQEFDKAVYPKFLAGKLAEAGYKLEADTTRKASDPDYLLNELRLTLKSRLTAFDMLWPDLAWDLFVHVFTETDRLFHFFMDAVLHHDHRLHAPCMDFLREWDRSIGHVLDKYDALPGPKRLIVMADHGFMESKTEVCLNTWLVQNQYLRFTAPPASGWDASKISKNSIAFALDPSRIHLVKNELATHSDTAKSDTQIILEKLKSELKDLTWNGERVIEEVFDGTKLYPGCDIPGRPDLVCQARPGFDLKAKFNRSEVFGFHGRTGMHTTDGAIFYDSEGSTPQRMRNIGQSILKYFNISND